MQLINIQEIQALAIKQEKDDIQCDLSDDDRQRLMLTVLEITKMLDTEGRDNAIRAGLWNAQKRAYNNEIKKCLKSLSDGYETRSMTLHYVPDFSDNTMTVYNEFGAIMEMRRLRPDERQLSLISNNNLTGTD